MHFCKNHAGEPAASQADLQVLSNSLASYDSENGKKSLPLLKAKSQFSSSTQAAYPPGDNISADSARDNSTPSAKKSTGPLYRIWAVAAFSMLMLVGQATYAVSYTHLTLPTIYSV